MNWWKSNWWKSNWWKSNWWAGAVVSPEPEPEPTPSPGGGGMGVVVRPRPRKPVRHGRVLLEAGGIEFWAGKALAGAAAGRVLEAGEVEAAGGQVRAAVSVSLAIQAGHADGFPLTVRDCRVLLGNLLAMCDGDPVRYSQELTRLYAGGEVPPMLRKKPKKGTEP